MWSGGCVHFQHGPNLVHVHIGIFLIKGSEKTVLIDTGHPAHWANASRDVEAFLDGRDLDYVFITHSEFPHGGLLTHWLRKYPGCKAVGNVTDMRLYFPEFADRFEYVDAGDVLDLGDRKLAFVPAVWRDLVDTLWAYEPVERILFVADAYSFVHYHSDDQCDYLLSEHPLPNAQEVRFINERALHWTRFTDITKTFPELDEMLRELRPRLIAPAHGGIVDIPQDATPLMKAGMDLGIRNARQG